MIIFNLFFSLFGDKPSLTPINWTMLEALGTCAAAAVSVFTLLLLRRQLVKEQEPFVVVRDDISPNKDGQYYIKLKNVGRGPALNITGCKTAAKDKRNDAFFANGQPHSKHFSANNADSEKNEQRWLIDKSLVNSLEEFENNEEVYKRFYLFYESQLGAIYYTEVKMKKNKNKFVVMDNRRVKC